MAPSKAEDIKINSDLYLALMNEDDQEVIRICRGISMGALHTLTIHEDTVLHMAIYQKKTDLALRLLDMVLPSDIHKLTWQNTGGNTILHETGTNNKTVEVAEEILRRAPMLLNMTNKEGETALFYAARHGKTKIYMLLHDEVCRATDGPDLNTFLRRHDKFNILHIAILSRNYKIACDIATNHKDLIAEKDPDEMTALQLLSTIKPKFQPKHLYKRILFKLIDEEVDHAHLHKIVYFFFKKLKKKKHACEWAKKITSLLIKEDSSWEKTESWTDKRGLKLYEYGGSMSATSKPEQKITATTPEANYHKASTPLLLATICDSTEIVRAILERYPQAVEHVDKEGHNILHLAILHRRLKIIDIVEDMEYPVERLRGKLDKKYNTLLHMVGQKVDELKEDVKHPAKELKEDQLLYERVKKMSTTIDKSLRNAEQKTPYEVYSETNDSLRTEAKEWMSENAKNCSIVAVLIATVAFTSAYTIPGGYGKSGQPVLGHKTMFLIFTIADALSLSTSLTSVVIFLNIVTSPFRFKDFASSLFEKQLIGLVLLIISVAMMMVAFAATLVLTIMTNEGHWSDMTLYGVSFFPVVVFVYSNLPDYLKMMRDIYRVHKKFVGKVVVSLRKIWDYKPQSIRPVEGHSMLRSPV